MERCGSGSVNTSDDVPSAVYHTPIQRITMSNIVSKFAARIAGTLIVLMATTLYAQKGEEKKRKKKQRPSNWLKERWRLRRPTVGNSLNRELELSKLNTKSKRSKTTSKTVVLRLCNRAAASKQISIVGKVNLKAEIKRPEGRREKAWRHESSHGRPFWQFR